MTGEDTRRYDMLTRVRNFGATHRQLFPGTSSAHDAFASVEAEIARLEALDVVERSASEGARADSRIAARAAFQQLLKRAGFTAHVLGKTIPELRARIPLPLPKGDLQLLTLARQFAAGVAGYGPEFAARGIPLAVLDEGIAAFEAAVAHGEASRDDRVKARAEREAAFERAMHAVATLDVTVGNSIVDPAALALWKHDRRIKPRRRAVTAATEVGPAASQPPASTEVPTPA